MTMPNIALEPAAAPVVPGIEPQNAGMNLEELAAGLSRFAPALGQFGALLQQRKNAGDEAAGKEAARKMHESVRSYRAAVKQGLITPDQSPWFRVGVKEEFGRLLADQYNSDLYLAAKQSPDVQNATDLRAFDQFEAKFRKQWLEDNVGTENQDNYFNQSFGSLADTYLAAQRENQAQQIGSRITQSGYDLHFARVMNLVRTEHARGTDPKAIAASIQQMSQDLLRLNPNGTAVNQATIDAVVGAAERMNDLTILDLLDTIGGGPGGSKLSNTAYGSAAIEKAQQEISTELAANDSREHERKQHAQADAVQGVLTQVAQRLTQAADPHTVDLSDMRAAMTKADPEKVQLVYQMQDAFSAHEYTDDPDVKSHLFMRVYGLDENKPGFLTEEDAAHALAARQITPATFNDLIAKMQERKDNAQKGLTSAFNDPGLKLAQKTMQDMFVSWLPGAIDNPTMRWRSIAAKAEITQAYLSWRNQEGAKASAEQINQWVTSETRRLFFTYSGLSDAEQFKQIGQPSFGSEKNSGTALLVDPERLNAMLSDFQLWQAHQSNNLSEETIAVLRSAGVPMTVKDIQTFLQNQMTVLNTVQAQHQSTP